MSTTEASTMSKSARQRAAKKLRDEAAAAEAAPAAPAPKATPKAAGKAKAKAEAAPAPVPEAKAKAKGKAKAEPAAPKAEAKAKGKAAAPAPAPAVAAPKAKGEAKAKAKGKAKAQPKEEEAPVRKVTAEGPPMEIDDGKGGDWEVSAGVSKKMQKQQEKKIEKLKEEAALKKAGLSGKAALQHIPGMASPADLLAEAQAKDAKGGNKGGQTHVAKAAAAIARVTAEAKVAKEAALAQATAGASGAVAAAPVDPNLTTAQVKIDAGKIGRIIGPKGANIILIKEKTGVKTIDTAGDLCTIVGLPDAVALAEHAIRELVEKGYMSLSFEDFKEDGVMVHPSSFPLLIGERGCIIQAIKKEAKVEIDIPSVPKTGAPSSKKYKVSLAGSKESVAKGIEIIESIVKHGYHEITHPGYSHAEMEVEEWKYRFLIGPGGSEMRHIQNNFKVKVNIPRETSATDKVVVLGEPADVERAVKYMEKRLFEAEQPKGREAPEKAQDDGGDDGPIEDWMKPYMYKR